MSCPSNIYSGGDDASRFWVNWSGRVAGLVERWFTPDSLPDLVNVVQQATRANRELRVFGSGWSFEDLVLTPPPAWPLGAVGPQWLVSLDRLNKRLPRVIDSALTDEWGERVRSGGADALVHVEAGIKIHALNDLLYRAGLALPTLGGANGQSIAGAISTGTHGSDIDQPPLSDLVMAMHIVTVDGQEYWVERASSRITDDGALAFALDCEDAQIIRADEMFNALLVGFGRFGVIYSYVLRATKAFRLAEWTVKIPRTTLMSNLRAGLQTETFLRPLLDGLPAPPVALHALNLRGLEVIFDTQNLGECWVKRRWLTKYVPTPSDTAEKNNRYVEDEDCQLGARGVLNKVEPWLAAAAAAGTAIPVAGQIWAILVHTKVIWLEDQLRQNPGMSAGDMVALVLRVTWDIGAGFLIPGRTAEAIGARFRDTTADGKRGPSHQIVSGFREASEQTCFRSNSVEPVFDAHKDGYLNFLDLVITEAPKNKQAGYISLRWSATSRATLSMHNYNSAHAVAIEVTSLKGLPDNDSWISQLMAFAFAHGGRPHWGQQNSFYTLPPFLNPLNQKTTVPEIYGESLVRWRNALTAMVGSGAVFSCNFTRQRQLEPNSADAVPAISGPSVRDIRGIPWQEQLGSEPITSGPGVCSWATGRLDVFVKNRDDTLWHKSYDGGWSGYEELGPETITSDPAAVSWANGRIDVFVRGADHTLWHKWYDGGQWSDYEQLGSEPIASGPGACSWATGRLDVFVKSTDDRLWHKWYDGGWSGYEQLGPDPITSDPDAVSWANGRIDVFVRGTDNTLRHKWYDGGRWSDYEQLGSEPIASGPGVCSLRVGLLHVFARSRDNRLWHKWYGGNWSGWESAGGWLTSDPTAVSWGNERIDVFGRGPNNALYHNSYG